MKLPPGIRRRKHVWQVYAKVHGQFLSKSLPLDTELGPLKEARRRLINKAKYGTPDEDDPDGKTFAHDAADYLTLVKHMPSYDDRAYEIGQWTKAFTGRLRSSIASRDIRVQLEKWRKSGRADGTGGLSVSSLNRRRTALMALWTTLDGKSGANPVKDVPPYDESHSQQIRSRDPRLLYRLIVRVGRKRWKARRAGNRGKRPTVSKTRARLRVMLWTGWPQKTLMRLKSEDIDWKAETVWIVGRKKGKGTRGQRLPLLPGAVLALKSFVDAKAFGEFSTSGMHKSLRRAVDEENAWRARFERPPVARVRPYDYRHTFGTEVAKRLTDERAIQSLMLHSSAAQTRRYTEAATAQRLLDAMEILGRKVAQKVPAQIDRAKRQQIA